MGMGWKESAWPSTICAAPGHCQYAMEARIFAIRDESSRVHRLHRPTTTHQLANAAHIAKHMMTRNLFQTP